MDQSIDFIAMTQFICTGFLLVAAYLVGVDPKNRLANLQRVMIGNDVRWVCEAHSDPSHDNNIREFQHILATHPDMAKRIVFDITTYELKFVFIPFFEGIDTSLSFFFIYSFRILDLNNKLFPTLTNLIRRALRFIPLLKMR